MSINAAFLESEIFLMKILIVTEQIYKIGGIEKLLSTKTKYWAENKNHKIIIATTENKGNKVFFNLSKNIKHIELTVNYNREKSLISPENIIKACRHLYYLKKLICETKPDVIINCCYGYDFYFLPLVKNNSKIIQEIHSSRVYRKNEHGIISKLKSYLISTFEKKYNSIVVLSPEEADAFCSGNAVVIPNPVDVNYNNKSNYDLNSRVVIAAGRIDSIKGFDRLIDIWSDLDNTGDNWELNILGDGNLAYINYLEQKIETLGLSESVKLYPSTQNLHTELSKASVYALCSHSECFPMVLLESMQSGLPIIAFDCPTGPRNIISNNVTGILVENNNLLEYKRKLQYLMQNEKTRSELSKNAQIEVQRYNLENVMPRWDILFNDLMLTNTHEINRNKTE